MTQTREQAVTTAFVSLASTLVDGFDVVELLSGLTSDCARLLDIASSGLLLADANGILHVLAASSEKTRQLELFQLQREQGPCLECYQSGTPVSVPDLSQEAQRWPQFVEAATAAGFASVHAVPMRLRAHRLGALGLFGSTVGALAEEDLSLAQALAYVASVALVQEKAAGDQQVIVEQLQTALTSRVVLEQAKGVLASRGDLEMDQAFALLRGYARDNNQRLTEVARAVVARELPARQLLGHAAQPASGRPTNK